MTDDSALVREKLDQVTAILDEQGIDLWLTFVHETQVAPDPCIELIVGTHVTWQSAFLLSRSGEQTAIVGRFDAPGLQAIGAYSDIQTYDESIRPVLLAAIERLDPQAIALNYSPSDPAADGLTHGMWLVLRETLEGTPYADRLVSSEQVVGSLRGRKTPNEVERIRAAIAETEEIFALVSERIAPGLKETEIAAVFHEEVARRGLGYAWEEGQCPAVDAGPEKEVGHTGPTDLETRRGQLVHTDFGVRKDEYCSDLQRMWYLLDEGESEAPEDVVAAWDTIWASMDAGAAVLRPGVAGHEVDAAARASLVAAGYDEPKHALGHQLGRAVHDGGTLLAPLWDRYGDAPRGLVEEGHVYTLEYGAPVPGRGFIALEEDVLVTADGLEWLSNPQRELWLVG
ncbi:MAG TPA: M24 family metallopeptidase [Gaiellaceae bacterium]|jgi:Xaa-Pro aminopeptidase